MTSTMTKKWCGKLCQWTGFATLFMVLTACGDIGGVGQCGGAGETGACLQIEDIAPNDSSNVDVVRDSCGTSGTPETFTDHNAKVKISYNRLPGLGLDAAELAPVTLNKNAISYKVAFCPVGSSCPSLNVYPIEQTISIKVDSLIEPDLPFFPLHKKDEYVDAVGSTNTHPSYTATYTLTGADSSGNPVKVEGSAEFTIGNYDLCTAAG